MLDKLFNDCEIIYSYTRNQALADGVLIDLNQVIPIHESGFKYPIACTSTVWAIISEAVNNKKYFNDIKGVVWDIMWMLKCQILKGNSTNEVCFQVIITGTEEKKDADNLYTFKSLCHPGDAGEPVITVMLPDED